MINIDNLPITNLYKWELENTLPVSLFIVQKENTAAIREMIGLETKWKGNNIIYHTYHYRQNDNGYRHTILNNVLIMIIPIEGITLRWEGNPFNIQM